MTCNVYCQKSTRVTSKMSVEYGGIVEEDDSDVPYPNLYGTYISHLSPACMLINAVFHPSIREPVRNFTGFAVAGLNVPVHELSQMHPEE